MISSLSESQEPHLDPALWVDLHGDTLYRFALKYVGDTTVAEDLVQETFLAALRARGSFTGQSAEKTWLVGILKHKIMDHFRKSAREADLRQSADLSRNDEEDFVKSGPETGTWLPTRSPADWMIDPNDPAEREEFWMYLQRCVGALDAKLAEAFVLRELEEIESKEICNILGISPTNLRVMLYRARKFLRRCLEKNWIRTGKAKR